MVWVTHIFRHTQIILSWLHNLYYLYVIKYPSHIPMNIPSFSSGFNVVPLALCFPTAGTVTALLRGIRTFLEPVGTGAHGMDPQQNMEIKPSTIGLQWCTVDVIDDTWYMIYDMVIYDMWYMTCDTWYMIYDMWYMTCDIWHVIYDTGYMTCDIWHVIYDMWYMIHDIHMTCDIWYMIYDRRKFRSQTSDNMERWKAEQGRGREKRKIRRERVRRQKIQMREKVGKSRNTVFFQWFVAPEGRL